eukprot:1149741-Pelagomonas_calceolata.AAC.10
MFLTQCQSEGRLPILGSFPICSEALPFPPLSLIHVLPLGSLVYRKSAILNDGLVGSACSSACAAALDDKRE